MAEHELTKNEIKKRKKRNALLNSAYELFTTVGYTKTTVLQIARRAGVGKGTFYLYFNDKTDIRDELIGVKSSQLLTRAVKALQQRTDIRNFADQLVFITDYIITALSKDIALLKFISKSLSWGMFKNSAEFVKKNEDVIDFQKFILNAMDEEGIHLKEPLLLIYTIIELTNSTCYNIILHGEPVTFSEYKPYLYNCIRLITNDAVEKGCQ
ncbi:MAG: TetR/AcrR family transcriptional regulator [Eubacterium sp.]|jgi:AcrR family transcriptional regulator|nr:TetR/AcrR family transcriptional regulator [Eubacterium sp.]MCH4006380.1 TetR/AcrR family transcriptional regulator [Eubacterium sp.]MCH4046637.1 TetR/AcrR family transcriptional regulator [Eubacterium sp.]MCH4079733.1 TetR/AcrR family transcriptional regulator [Eubacterium sp.]MCH4110293.1 TetR/AcrR family transcriptional regulator [Eubacterium sp.]